MRILLLGGMGQVGLAVRRAAAVSLVAPSRSEVDLTDVRSLQQGIDRAEADVVINAAAYTDVDRAERERDLAHRINAVAPGVIAQACARRELPLIHLSSDYVFDGRSEEALDEDAPTNPLNVYGRTKLEGEQRVRAATDRHIILRVASVFGPEGRNFVRTMLRLFATEPLVRVVADQVSCPTPAAAIAETVLRLCDSTAAAPAFPWGLYHYAGTPAVSWFEFANAIHDAASRHHSQLARLTPVSAAGYARPAARPGRTALDCSRIERLGFALPSWREALFPLVRGELAGR